MADKKPNPNIDGDFEDFLREEGRLRVSTVMAVNRVKAWRKRVGVGLLLAIATIALALIVSRHQSQNNGAAPSAGRAGIEAARFALGDKLRCQ